LKIRHAPDKVCDTSREAFTASVTRHTFRPKANAPKVAFVEIAEHRTVQQGAAEAVNQQLGS